MVADSYPRNLGFSATYNFRDVGGYAGLDGRTVRWRRLFRSDALHRLGEADAEAFEALGVRTVIDLRRPFEIEKYGRIAARHGLDYRNLVLGTWTGTRWTTPTTCGTSVGWPTGT